MSTLLLADFGLFIGRFHPLVVHLPIGFLLLAVGLEFWPGRRLTTAIRISWVAGAVAAVVAAVCGWLLAREAGGGATLDWHRWLGITVAVLAAGAYFVAARGGWATRSYGILVATALGVTGHLGGNLTHGEEYLLQHAPDAVRRAAGFAPVADSSAVNVDSINLFREFLEPAIRDKCVRCHNADKQSGGLRMDQARYLYAGGDGGALFTPGDALGSRWVTRVTLPRHERKAMPPRGEPWDYATVELLRYWIEAGADTLMVLDPRETPEGIRQLIERDYGLDLSPRLFAEKLTAPALGRPALGNLERLHWAVTELVPGRPALEVKVQAGKRIDPEALQPLAESTHQQLVYLSLDNQVLTDTDLTPLRELVNLNRLRLNGTAITAAGVRLLEALPHLESLSLHTTRVTDEVFPILGRFPALKRVYLYQTETTPSAIADFAAARPDIEVITGG